MTRISFGILALNAQPFLEYNLRALYPFAHQIIVVEGATRPAEGLARPDGHSVDGTLEMLAKFKANSDPDGKLSIVLAKDEGFDSFWPEKDEMSQAYAVRATGDWLWQVDSDEFYRANDMRRIREILDAAPSISGASFPFHEFWGGFDYLAMGPWHMYEFKEVARLFRWRPGYSYVRHRPPTILDNQGHGPDPQTWLSGKRMERMGIYMYHYSYVFPKQAEQKVGYYSNVQWTNAFSQNHRWFQDEYLELKHPMFLSDRGWPICSGLIGTLEVIPKSIAELRNALNSGKINQAIRPNQDIEQLLASPMYRFEKISARFLLALYWPFRAGWKSLRAILVGQKPTKTSTV